MMKLTIDRSKWWRGNGSGESRLLRPDGTMCCLGFLGRACGYTDEQLLDVTTPAAAVDGIRGQGTARIPQPNLWPKGTVVKAFQGHYTTQVIDEMMVANDSPGSGLNIEGRRELRIKELMLDIDVEVEFV